MARRIKFIAPIEGISGNLSGKQELRYPTNTTAWNSDENAQAENFVPRYIGRFVNGKYTYAVKQRATAANTANQRRAMAVFGGTCAVVDAISSDVTHIQTILQIFRAQSYYKTLRAFLTAKVRPALEEKSATFTISGGTSSSVTYNNPWISGGSGTQLTIDTALLNKFMQYLGNA